MVALRSQVPAERHAPTHFRTMPLPTAGVIPMAQLVCSPYGRNETDAWGFKQYPYSLMHNFLGALEFITKPVPPQEMESRIRNMTTQMALLSDQLDEQDSNFNITEAFKVLLPAGQTLAQTLAWAMQHPEFMGYLNRIKEIANSVESRIKSEDLLDEYLAQNPDGGGPPLYPNPQRGQNGSTPIYRCGTPELPLNWTRWSPDGERSPNATEGNKTIEETRRRVSLAYDIIQVLLCDVEPYYHDDSDRKYRERMIEDITAAFVILGTDKLKIPYAPTFTAADEIIREAQGYLGIINDISFFMVEWVRLSIRIRNFVNSPGFINFIKNILDELWRLLFPSITPSHRRWTTPPWRTIQKGGNKGTDHPQQGPSPTATTGSQLLREILSKMHRLDVVHEPGSDAEEHGIHDDNTTQVMETSNLTRSTSQAAANSSTVTSTHLTSTTVGPPSQAGTTSQAGRRTTASTQGRGTTMAQDTPSQERTTSHSGGQTTMPSWSRRTTTGQDTPSHERTTSHTDHQTTTPSRGRGTTTAQETPSHERTTSQTERQTTTPTWGRRTTRRQRFTTRRRYRTTPGVPPNVMRDIRRIVLVVLNVLDTGACRWLDIAADLDFLNIFMGFRSEDAIVYFNREAYEKNISVFAGIVFDMIPGTPPPRHVKYKIRQNATFTPTTRLRLPQSFALGPKFEAEFYYMFGFLWIQDIMDRSIIEWMVGRDVHNPGAYVQHMPFPCYIVEEIQSFIQHMLPLAFCLSWVYIVAMLVRNVVHEKETRIREVMKMMGLKGSALRVSWFITTLFTSTITVITIALMLHYGGFLRYSEISVTLVLGELYTLSAIQLSFLISACFSKAKLGAACSGIIYLIIYIPYMYVSIREDAGATIPLWAKILSALFCNSAVGMSGRYYAFFEVQYVGLKWSNIFDSPSERDQFSMASIMIMLVIDTILYTLLAWYIENVFPGDYGIPEKWYFPLQYSYWCRDRVNRKGTSTDVGLDIAKDDEQLRSDIFSALEEGAGASRYFETDPTHLPLGISIQNLRKVFSNGKVAVDNLSLNLYEGQILSFLGHNGAGKTTTMSILSGMFPATSGTATIYGSDIRTGLKQIRTSLGLCPQHNVLFDSLTVEEHLLFYARLKGVPPKILRKEIESFLEDTGLTDKRDNSTDTLSGGMKRKLSVGIAFIGGSKTVILDEPTAGVDPHSRRDIWELLVKYKKGRTIMLSTHHMDEADILGDRIAIISAGKLKCCGSSIFLKTTFGDGYHLTLVKSKTAVEREQLSRPASTSDLTSIKSSSPHGPGGAAGLTVIPEDEECPTSPVDLPPFNTNKVTTFIRCNVPNAKLTDESHRELTYTLPFSETRTVQFAHLFDQLDRYKDKLQVSSYGVSDTSLEEVFIKVMKTNFDREPDRFDFMRNFGRIPVDSSDLSASNSHQGTINKPPKYLRRLSNMNDQVFMDGASWMRPLDPVTGRPVKRVRNFGRSMSVDTSSSSTSLVDMDEVDSGIQEAVDPMAKAECNGAGPYRLKGCRLWWRQFYSCLQKRLFQSRRNIKGLLIQILLPSVFMAIAMTMGHVSPQVESEPPLVLSPVQYFNLTPEHGSFIPVSHQQRYNGKHTVDAGPEALINTFDEPSGVAATCVLHRQNLDVSGLDTRYLTRHNVTRFFTEDCLQVFFSDTERFPFRNLLEPAEHLLGRLGDLFTGWTGGLGSTGSQQHAPTGDIINRSIPMYPVCECKEDSSGFVCPQDGFRSPPQHRIITKDMLQDITFQNESEYQLYTNNKYRHRRYGGVSFGNMYDHVPPWWRQVPLLNNLITKYTAKVMHHSQGYHSAPAFLNVLNNAILRANLPREKGEPSAYGITVTNQPMNGTLSLMSVAAVVMGPDLVIAIFVIAGMSFTPAGFILAIVTERSKNIKHLQFVSGLSPVIYWVTNLLWDMMTFAFPVAICVMVLALFQLPSYTAGDNFTAVGLLFGAFVFSITPMIYPASFAFKEPSAAYVFLIIFNMGLGVALVFVTALLDVFRTQGDTESLRLISDVNGVLQWVFLVVPSYALGRGMMNIALNHHVNEFMKISGQVDKVRSPFQFELTGRNYVFMMVMGVLFFLLTLLLEYQLCSRKKRLTEAQLPDFDTNEDADVRDERDRVRSQDPGADYLQLRDLTKYYAGRGRSRFLAVSRLHLGVPQGECFGLLGVNGAGKTTTFKMMTGEYSPSGGEAFIAGLSLRESLHEARKKIGYCPQFDALYDELTAREHLKLYTRFKGIPGESEEEVIEWALRKLELSQYADKPSGTYSGGNKRKLSTAIALIGNPGVVFLDEPTAGMDPYAKRFLWNLILSLTKEGKCIILTSHSMEECETLCNRLAIMVAGRFRCIGSVQHLKTCFGDGYTIKLRVPGPRFDAQITRLLAFMRKNLPAAELKEAHLRTVKMEIRAEGLSLSHLFNRMEAARKKGLIEDYSVCQNTLDNVFINFVKLQYQANDEAVSVSADIESGHLGSSQLLPGSTALRQESETNRGTGVDVETETCVADQVEQGETVPTEDTAEPTPPASTTWRKSHRRCSSLEDAIDLLNSRGRSLSIAQADDIQAVIAADASLPVEAAVVNPTYSPVQLGPTHSTAVSEPVWRRNSMYASSTPDTAPETSRRFSFPRRSMSVEEQQPASQPRRLSSTEETMPFSRWEPGSGTQTVASYTNPAYEATETGYHGNEGTAAEPQYATVQKKPKPEGQQAQQSSGWTGMGANTSQVDHSYHSDTPDMPPRPASLEPERWATKTADAGPSHQPGPSSTKDSSSTVVVMDKPRCQHMLNQIKPTGDTAPTQIQLNTMSSDSTDL